MTDRFTLDPFLHCGTVALTLLPIFSSKSIVVLKIDLMYFFMIVESEFVTELLPFNKVQPNWMIKCGMKIYLPGGPCPFPLNPP